MQIRPESWIILIIIWPKKVDRIFQMKTLIIPFFVYQIIWSTIIDASYTLHIVKPCSNLQTFSMLDMKLHCKNQITIEHHRWLQILFIIINNEISWNNCDIIIIYYTIYCIQFVKYICLWMCRAFLILAKRICWNGISQ